eukprot:2690855-Amphidinium_carterae.1
MLLNTSSEEPEQANQTCGARCTGSDSTHPKVNNQPKSRCEHAGFEAGGGMGIATRCDDDKGCL